jgi:hypothetical protein
MSKAFLVCLGVRTMYYANYYEYRYRQIKHDSHEAVKKKNGDDVEYVYKTCVKRYVS